MNEENLIQILIQGGAVGIAVLLILYSMWKDKLYNKTLSNHLKHFNDALDRNTEMIRKNSEIMGKVFETNERVAKILDRVEYKMNRK